MTLTHKQFEAVRAKFAVLRRELDNKALTDFLKHAEDFAANAPYTPTGDQVMRQDWDALVGDVKSAVRASTIQNGETSEYRRFRAACDRGEFGHPEAPAKNESHAELTKAFNADPAMYHKQKGLLGGLTKADKQKDWLNE